MQGERDLSILSSPQPASTDEIVASLLHAIAICLSCDMAFLSSDESCLLFCQSTSKIWMSIDAVPEPFVVPTPALGGGKQFSCSSPAFSMAAANPIEVRRREDVSHVSPSSVSASICGLA